MILFWLKLVNDCVFVANDEYFKRSFMVAELSLSSFKLSKIFVS